MRLSQLRNATTGTHLTLQLSTGRIEARRRADGRWDVLHRFGCAAQASICRDVTLYRAIADLESTTRATGGVWQLSTTQP